MNIIAILFFMLLSFTANAQFVNFVPKYERNKVHRLDSLIRAEQTEIAKMVKIEEDIRCVFLDVDLPTKTLKSLPVDVFVTKICEDGSKDISKHSFSFSNSFKMETFIDNVKAEYLNYIGDKDKLERRLRKLETYINLQMKTP